MKHTPSGCRHVDEITESSAAMAMQQRLAKQWPNLLRRYAFDPDRLQLNTTPPITRQSVKPHSWSRANRKPDRKLPWGFSGIFRRLVLLVLVLVQTGFAVNYLSALLPYQGWSELRFWHDWQLNPTVAFSHQAPYLIEMLLIILFAILFAWISLGFWTAMMGIWVTLSGGERHTLAIPVHPADAINPAHRTALVVPICNEDVARVFACVKASWQSLVATGQQGLCDVYLLSDTSDPDIYANELKLWADVVDELGESSSLYYRHRERRVKRKSGNIDDFCRRFGNQYEYMIILDADSIMSGTCVLNLIAMMEMTPQAGIIQSPPKTVRMRTLYGRIQQFASQTYGDIFSRGVHYWQLSEAQYWGHNAIIRIKPFMQHCMLAPFKRRGQPHPILSHDLVEAALMRKAGWQVWIAHNLQGSYEEVPGNLIEDLKRDNRWCMGNLINLRVLTKPGIRLVHRLMFVTSAMAYVTSLLWLLFLLLSTLLLLMFSVSDPQYFLHPNQLYPVWPRWDEQLAIELLGTTFALLLAPKIASYFILLATQGARAVGGLIPFTLSILLEIVFSIVLAPIKMIFHSLFVVKALLGSKVHWKSPSRSDDALTWQEAIVFCWPLVLIGALWLGAVLWLNPQFTTWFIAILLPLIISPLVAKLTSLRALGMAAQRRSLFLTPEEVAPNPVIAQAESYLSALSQQTLAQGYAAALADPALNCLTRAMSTRRHHSTAKQAAVRAELLTRCLGENGQPVSDTLKLKAMADPVLLNDLHAQVI